MPIHTLLTKALLVTGAVFLLIVSASAEPDSRPLTVVIPQVPAPFDKVFAEIVEGIKRGAGDHRTHRIFIDDQTTPEALDSKLQQQPGAVIGLGNQAKKLLIPLEPRRTIVYGAVFLNPDNEPEGTEGISLTPSPDATLKWLRTLVPAIKTVHVVYQEQYNGWLVALAAQSAPQHHLTLHQHAVNNVREAAAEFRSILKDHDPDTHAIWLMQRDPSLDEKAVLPDILAQAWNRDFVVFSSNPSHVSRGALFALYPDNKKMGSSLAKLALEPTEQGIVPLDDLLIAVNVRTASHIGKNFNRSEEKRFNLIFPNR